MSTSAPDETQSNAPEEETPQSEAPQEAAPEGDAHEESAPEGETPAEPESSEEEAPEEGSVQTPPPGSTDTGDASAPLTPAPEPSEPPSGSVVAPATRSPGAAPEVATADLPEEEPFIPHLMVGARGTILPPHENAGRMVVVTSVEYTDPIQTLLANSGTPAAASAKVQDYIVRTRDGRSDTIVVPPDQLQPLEVNEGWGRGQI